MFATLNYVALVLLLAACLTTTLLQVISVVVDGLAGRLRALAGKMSRNYEIFISLPLAAAVLGALLGTAMSEGLSGARKWISVGTPPALNGQLYIAFVLAITALFVSVLFPYAIWSTFRPTPEDLSATGNMRMIEEAIEGGKPFSIRHLAPTLMDQIRDSRGVAARITQKIKGRFRIQQLILCISTVSAASSLVASTGTEARGWVFVIAVVFALSLNVAVGWVVVRYRVRQTETIQKKLEVDAEVVLKSFRRALQRSRHRTMPAPRPPRALGRLRSDPESAPKRS